MVVLGITHRDTGEGMFLIFVQLFIHAVELTSFRSTPSRQPPLLSLCAAIVLRIALLVPQHETSKARDRDQKCPAQIHAHHLRHREVRQWYRERSIGRVQEDKELEDTRRLLRALAIVQISAWISVHL